MGGVRADADGAQHVAGLKRMRAARRPARNAEAAHVEAQDERFAFERIDQHMHDVGQVILRAGRNLDRGTDAGLFSKRGVELVAKGSQALLLVGLLFLGDLDGRGEARRAADVLGAAAPAGLLAASKHEGVEGRAAFHIQRADALRAAHLVSGKRSGIAVPIDHVDGHFAQRLRGIGVEQRACGVRRTGKLGHRLHRTDLGVRRHDADEHRFRAHDLLKRGFGYEAVAVGLHARDREAHLLETLGRGKDRIVLDGADHHVRLHVARAAQASGMRRGLRQPDDGGVIGLGGAAGEDHLVGTRGA